MKKLIKFIKYLIKNLGKIYHKWSYDYYKSEKIFVRPGRIEIVVCKYFKTTKEKIYDRTRKQPYIYRRQLIQYFMRKFTGLSDGQIAKDTGNYDRVTVYSNSNAIQNYIDTDKFKRIEIEKIEKILTT